MKSSNMQALNRPLSVVINNAEEADKWIKQIQLDAMKEGMLRAAYMARLDSDDRYEIIVASTQLTIKNLLKKTDLY
jgi:hypothetical protein